MDAIERSLPWLDDNFRDARNEGFEYADAKGKAIAAQLVERWGKGDRVELLGELAKAWGKEALYSTLDTIVMRHAEEYWRSVAVERGDDSFDSFKAALWDPLGSMGFEISSSRVERDVRFNVTRCPHADIAREKGLCELFYHLVCVGDPAAIRGFNPEIGFKRSCTLMDADRCDHCYTLG
jgi:hypothetical protein